MAAPPVKVGKMEAFPIGSITGDRYALRALSLDHLDKRIASLPEGEFSSELARYRNIIAQSDPDELFKDLNQKKLRQYITDFETKATGRFKGSSTPDSKMFGEFREYMGQHIHHRAPLAENKNAIPDSWSQPKNWAQLYNFHRTLNQFDFGAGSSIPNLKGYLAWVHLNQVHGASGGTKVEPFKALTNVDDGELAAVEFLTNNMRNYSIADKFAEGDFDRLQQQVRDLPDNHPLRRAIIATGGDPTKIEGFITQQAGKPIDQVETELTALEVKNNKPKQVAALINAALNKSLRKATPVLGVAGQRTDLERARYGMPGVGGPEEEQVQMVLEILSNAAPALDVVNFGWDIQQALRGYAPKEILGGLRNVLRTFQKDPIGATRQLGEGYVQGVIDDSLTGGSLLSQDFQYWNNLDVPRTKPVMRNGAIGVEFNEPPVRPPRPANYGNLVNELGNQPQ